MRAVESRSGRGRSAVRWIAVAGAGLLGIAGLVLRADLLEEWRLRGLRSPDAGRRLAAARALGATGTPRAIDGLLEALAASDAEEALAWGVLRLDMGLVTGEEATFLFRGTPGEPYWAALLALVDRCGSSCVARLAGALDDPELFIRQGSALLLRRLGRRAGDALPALEEALRKDNSPVSSGWLRAARESVRGECR